MDPKYKIGMRSIKTAVAVGACLLVFRLTGLSDGIQASIASIICMKSSLQNSIETGIERILGTIIGAVLGTLALLLISGQPFMFFALLATLGVIVIIYLCNIFKLQGSIIISLVVFLVILLGDKGMSPVAFGLNRLLETFFGIIIAFLINRFIFPTSRSWNLKKSSISEEIRPFRQEDMGMVMSLWLSSNLRRYPLTNELLWHDKYDSVRDTYKNEAKIYVYAEDNMVLGFVAMLKDASIDGPYAVASQKNKKIKMQLLAYCQNIYPSITAKVYPGNDKLDDIFLKAGFHVSGEAVDSNTKVPHYIMEWSLKH